MSYRYIKRETTEISIKEIDVSLIVAVGRNSFQLPDSVIPSKESSVAAGRVSFT
jgi:hypothetical protein